MDAKTIRAAVRASLPVMAGYVVLGMGFGVLLQDQGYGFLWAILMSLTIYAGSMQYAALDLISGGAGLITTALMTLMINARHFFYGLSMLDKYQKAGKAKPYLIFALTDETYALLSSAKPPQGVRDHDFYFAVALLDHIYWIGGSVLGSLVGAALGMDTTGVDCAMTALFLVIAVGQWKAAGSHLPVLLGAAATIASLMLVGADEMLLPALAVIVLGLTMLRPRLDDAFPKPGKKQEVRV